MDNLQSFLGIWPTDCGRQQLYIEQLKTYLRQVETSIQVNYAHSIFISQSNEPSQSDWELAWVEQSGLPLPIPPSVNLYWLSEDNTICLGLFGSIEGSSLISRRIGASSSSGIGMYHSKSEYYPDTPGGGALTFSSSNPIGQEFVYTEEFFTLPTKCDLILQFVSYGFGAGGPVAMDFVLDNKRVAVEYYDMGVGEGFSRAFEGSPANTPGSLGAMALVPDVEGGEHRIKITIGGVDGSVAGGSYSINGYTSLIIGIAQ